MINEFKPEVNVAVCDGREIVFRDYGPKDAPVVLAHHGLGGQGLNFDILARYLSSDFRVICPDMIGRGGSSWAKKPKLEYCFGNYQFLLGELLDQLGIEQFHWVGTSMGGALAIYCAGHGWESRIRSMVLNDIGPEVEPAVLKSIAQAVSLTQRFSGYRALADHLAEYLGVWAGRADDVQHWRRLALNGSRRCDDGSLVLHHDTAIAAQFHNHPEDYRGWDSFNRIICPLLIIRGTLSTVLTETSMAEMLRRKPDAAMHLVEHWGHAPFLDTADEVKVVADFLSLKSGC